MKDAGFDSCSGYLHSVRTISARMISSSISFIEVKIIKLMLFQTRIFWVNCVRKLLCNSVSRPFAQYLKDVGFGSCYGHFHSVSKFSVRMISLSISFIEVNIIKLLICIPYPFKAMSAKFLQFLPFPLNKFQVSRFSKLIEID